MEFEIREAGSLAYGSVIANVGNVLAVRPEGVFIHVHVRRFPAWSPATGMSSSSLCDLYFHVTDEVVVERVGD
jgi:hypothetical protein